MISVGAGLPGASPETMASAVATPLERQFGRIAGVNQMTSTSQLGSTEHHPAVRPESQYRCRGARCAGRHQRRSQPAARQPAEQSHYRKVNPADAPILILALTSDTITLPQIYDAADSILAQKLAQVEGVGQVFVGGGASPRCAPS